MSKTTEKVNPRLRKVAEAICREEEPDGLGDWEDYLGHARSALNALADSVDDGPVGQLIGSDDLREIAAEPKPSAEDLLNEHVVVSGSVVSVTCRCGTETSAGFFTAHVADMLRDAGLLAEEAE